MAVRYTAEELEILRDSPLCVKPERLPSTDEWMGPPLETGRTQQGGRTQQPLPFTKFRNNVENPLHDQTNRRPGPDRHVSRNSASNPDEIVFGPPRMAFASSGRATKTTENEKGPIKESDTQPRFGDFRRNDSETSDRSSLRTANPLRRRPDGNEQDSDGWTAVKPRKSFGAEGAERFHGRMGGNFRDDKNAVRDPNSRAPARPFDTFSRDRMRDDTTQPRNGTDKNGTEAWHKSKNSESARVPEKRERIDRAKNWRERGQEPDQPQDHASRQQQQGDRRWGGERREREPEWMDEPADPKGEARTQQDFQKWMEDMKKTKTSEPSHETPDDHFEARPVASAPAVAEHGPDKFFMAFGSKTQVEVATTPGEPVDAPSRPKPAGKSSRFTSFFQSQDVKTENPTPVTGPPTGAGVPLPPGLIPAQPPKEEEKQAFQQLLMKLQKQSFSATPPGPSPFAPPPGQPNIAEHPKNAQMAGSPFDALLGGGGERRDGPHSRPHPQHAQEIHAPRPQPQTARPEQLLQDLVGHHQRVSSRGSGRADDGAARNNSNTEFLMNLMRAGSGSMEAKVQKQNPPQPGGEREHELARDNRNLPRQPRPGPPPGFPMDESDFMPNQPTQILQRPPPPPGLDQMPPNWMGGGVQLPPLQPPQQQPQRGPMLPPPGLAGGPGRNPPMPPMFPPNFPPGAMPMPEGMGNMPPRNMGPPPPGFFGQAPPGFLPPGMAGFNGPPGPESPGGFGPQSPFEARGMPAPGGRGGGFGRG